MRWLITESRSNGFGCPPFVRAGFSLGSRLILLAKTFVSLHMYRNGSALAQLSPVTQQRRRVHSIGGGSPHVGASVIFHRNGRKMAHARLSRREDASKSDRLVRAWATGGCIERAPLEADHLRAKIT